MGIIRLCLVVLFVSAVVLPARAGEETSALSSPKCDMEKLKKLIGDGLVKIVPGVSDGIYNVTIDTAKVTSGDIVKKMLDAGCF